MREQRSYLAPFNLSTESFTVVDLFAGAGGLSLGFRMAGADIQCMLEMDARHVDAYRESHGNTHVIAKSIVETSPREILFTTGLVPYQLDFLVGGPPCQPFSFAGKRNGEADERGTLMDDFVRFVDVIRPKVFVIENVLGFRSIHGGNLIGRIVENLQAMKYRCEVMVLDAADFGVPQHRKRLFLIGSRLPQFNLSPPVATHGPDGRLEMFRKMKAYVTVRDAISDLPTCSADEGDDLFSLPYTCAPNAYQTSMRNRKRRVNGVSTTVHQSHIVKSIDLKNLPEGAVEPSTWYRRLYWDRPAFTLRAGSGSFTALRPVHPTEPRVITVREAARIQSFPDNVAFSTHKVWAYRQIGNSVPPLLGRAVARKLMDELTQSQHSGT